ncbi:(2Fe-2S) ferredoxin domain-containing protein [Thermoflavimicrobium daqui]|uniref:Ferredoxin n=1 Tax=Thermoflavimicrobium daqui TaxID=2137476 RepID=A0A364K424_9BACL|nr:(2Fe-2S) ferredoxin domain-containing protein [Thermoflavimicrobium daqui]RAL24087.1 ferredoxin [Thermoflavimicrobium daqui]
MELSGVRQHLLICNGGTCLKKGGEEVAKSIRAEIKKQEMNRTIHTTITRCNGRCEDGCTVILYPEGVWYKEMTPESGVELVKSLAKGEILSSQTSYHHNGKEFIRSNG